MIDIHHIKYYTVDDYIEYAGMYVYIFTKDEDVNNFVYLFSYGYVRIRIAFDTNFNINNSNFQRISQEGLANLDEYTREAIESVIAFALI